VTEGTLPIIHVSNSALNLEGLLTMLQCTWKQQSIQNICPHTGYPPQLSYNPYQPHHIIKTSTLNYNVDEDLSSITNCVLFRLLILWSFSTSSFCKFSTSWEPTYSTNTSPKTILYQLKIEQKKTEYSWNPNLLWIDPTILMVDWGLYWFTC
jgi:hypothetical protein